MLIQVIVVNDWCIMLIFVLFSCEYIFWLNNDDNNNNKYITIIIILTNRIAFLPTDFLGHLIITVHIYFIVLLKKPERQLIAKIKPHYKHIMK